MIFTAIHTFITVIQLIIQFCNVFMKFVVTPVIHTYLSLAFRAGGHFLLQYLQNSMGDFKIVRQFEHFSNQYSLWSF